ncbi:MAG: hypothetical protein V2A72_06145 [Candidatus Omnitrophota bacterium]
MEKNLFISNFKKLPKGFLIFILLAFAFEGFNIIFDDYFYASSHAMEGLRMNIKNKFSQNRRNDFDIIVLGDCYNSTGVNPNLIYEKTQKSCWNFSTYAWQTSFAAYCLFNNYMKACKKKPKLLIIGYIPQIGLSWTKKDIATTKIFYLYEFKQGNVTSFAKMFGVASVLKMFVPSLKHQGILKRFFAEPIAIIKNIPSRQRLNNVIASVYKDKGYDATVEEGIYKGGGVIEEPLRPISPFFKQNLESILDTALKNNMKVIYLIPTSPPGQGDKDKYFAFLKEYKHYINSCKEKYSNMIILHPQGKLNSDEFYGQTAHLNKKGMLILNDYLAEQINRLNFNDSFN